MAHSKQAQKRIRQTEKRNAANTAERSRLRTFVKKLEEAIAAADKKEIPAAFKAAMSELHKAGRKGLMSREAASRKISRLAARISKATS